MSKLSFRARALDAARPMAVYLGEELPDLPDHSAISRAVPAMPTGMEKDEECEHHLQRAICTGLIIPTPEVTDMSDVVAYDRIYPSDYTKPRQLIHMQPLGLEQEVPDYDMDSEDEKWLKRQHAASGGRASELTELKFEETMEKLEKGSGQTVVTLREARALAGRAGLADHILAAVYDYWLNKRLATQQPLLLAVRTEPRPGAPQASPYLAFRRRTEKMQTRKNRKNDESSYEKMVKLRRELSQVVTLLDMIRQREKLKREGVRLTASIIDKRYIAHDFGGNIIAEAKAAKVAVTPALLVPPFATPHHRPLDSAARQREKRQYKRRKHRHHSSTAQSHTFHHGGISGSSSSSEGEGNESGTVPPVESSGPFTFRRKPGCQYHMPTIYDYNDEVPWMTESCKENTHPGGKTSKQRYILTSINHPKPRCIGFARRRIGRGGRVILDRLSYPSSDDRLWESLGYTVTDSQDLRAATAESLSPRRPNFSHSPKPPAVADSVLNKIECGSSRSPNFLEPNIKFNKTADEVKVPRRERRDSKASMTQVNDDVTIKTEIDEIQFSDSEKLDRLDSLRRLDTERNEISNVERADGSSDSDSVVSRGGQDSYNSEINYNCSAPNRSGAFKRYRNRSVRTNDERRIATHMYDEDMKVMAELLVAKRLERYEQRVPDVSSSLVDNFLHDIWGNRLHFKPKPPDPDVIASRADREEEMEKISEHSPITVRVRLALPEVEQPPSDLLFTDNSPFVTSEFTLADLYGDTIIDPNPDVDMSLSGDEHAMKEPIAFKEISWSQTNGPVKAVKSVIDEEGCEGIAEDSTASKAELSDNSSSNQTSVFLSSEGGPPSAASVSSDTVAYCAADESNHEGTNGVVSEWNDSNESDKMKQLLKKPGNGLANKFKSAVSAAEGVESPAVTKTEQLVNNQKKYSDCDRTGSPSFPSLLPTFRSTSSNQSTLLSATPERNDQRKIEVQNQNLAIVQLKTPAILPQSKVKQVFKSVLTGDGVEARAPLLVSSAGRQSGSPVRVRSAEDAVSSSGQQQQLVTLAVSDSFKLRVPGHLLNSGNAGGATNSTHDLLGLVHHKTSSLPRDGLASNTHRTVVQVTGGTAGRPVRLVHARPLSPSQRSKIMPPGPFRLRGIANLLQLQMRSPNKRTETIETAPQPVEAVSAGSTAAGTGGEAGPASSGPAPAAGPPSTAGKPPPPASPRKSQASLPMEVT